MVRHLGKFECTTELLRVALGLPGDTVILGIEMTVEQILNPRSFTIYVEHPDLPETPESALVMTVCPEIKGNGNALEFVSWG